MTVKQRKDNFINTLRKAFRRHARRHDPMRVLHISNFNFADGWNRTFSKHEYARFYA